MRWAKKMNEIDENKKAATFLASAELSDSELEAIAGGDAIEGVIAVLADMEWALIQSGEDSQF